MNLGWNSSSRPADEPHHAGEDRPSRLLEPPRAPGTDREQEQRGGLRVDEPTVEQQRVAQEQEQGDRRGDSAGHEPVGQQEREQRREAGDTSSWTPAPRRPNRPEAGQDDDGEKGGWVETMRPPALPRATQGRAARRSSRYCSEPVVVLAGQVAVPQEALRDDQVVGLVAVRGGHPLVAGYQHEHQAVGQQARRRDDR